MRGAQNTEKIRESIRIDCLIGICKETMSLQQVATTVR